MVKRFLLVLVLFLVLAFSAAASAAPLDLAPAELSNWTRTSSSQEVVNYVKYVAANSNGRIRYEDMGYTVFDTPIPLAIVGVPTAPLTPADVGNRVVVHVQCNIHSGEVEGKEGSLAFLREIAEGKWDDLLSGDIVLTVNSNFNPDGNDMLSNWRASSQPTPALVGTRGNSQSLNLNRDFIKLDSYEARSHLRIFRKWNPAIIMDQHATDGNRHRHPICYGYGNNLNNDQGFENFNRLFVESIYGLGIGEFSNAETNFFQKYIQENVINDADNPLFASNYYPVRNASLRALPYTESAVTTTLTSGNGHGARYTSNLPTIKNRIGILYECHSHNTFRYRVHTMYAATVSTVEQAKIQKDEILKYIKGKDAEASNRTNASIANEVVWLGARSFQAVNYDLGDGVGLVRAEGFNGSDYTSVVSRVIPNNSSFYPLAANPSTPMGAHYIMDSGAYTSAELLLRHGVKVYKLREDILLTPADNYRKFYGTGTQGRWTVGSGTAYEGRVPTTITNGDWGTLPTNHTVRKGHYVISTAQPFGKFAAYMLEPRADDGLCYWAFWDTQLRGGETSGGGQGASFDIYKTFDYNLIPNSALELLVHPEDEEQAPSLDAKGIKGIFASGELPDGAVIEEEELSDGTKRYYLVIAGPFFGEGMLLDGDSLLKNWALAGVNPHSGVNWYSSITGNKIMAYFTGEVKGETTSVTLIYYQQPPFNQVKLATLWVKFSGDGRVWPGPIMPNLPIKPDNVELKQASVFTKVEDLTKIITSIKAQDLTLNSEGHVVVSSNLAKQAAQDALKAKGFNNNTNKEAEKVVLLPIITATLDTAGNIAAIGYCVKGSDLFVQYVSDVKLLKVLASDSKNGDKGALFDYASNPAQFGDKKFTIQTVDNRILAKDEKILPDELYKFTLFVKDGGAFDLDGRPRIVVDPAVLLIDNIATQSDNNSNSGCNTGFGLIALALLGFIARKFSKK